jgi:hypothetical protein
MKSRKCKRTNVSVYGTLVSGIIRQLCVTSSVVKEITNQLVDVEDQGQTTTRGLLLRPSRRQSENEKRGEDEEDDATIDLNRRIAEAVERTSVVETENEVLRSRVEATEAGLCQLYSRSITTTTVGERRRLEVSAPYKETQELALVVPDMCKHIIEFTNHTGPSTWPQRFSAIWMLTSMRHLRGIMGARINKCGNRTAIEGEVPCTYVQRLVRSMY